MYGGDVADGGLTRYLAAMFGAAEEFEPLVNMIFLVATGWIAWHGIRYRTPDGDTDFVRLLFGCIAAVFFCLVLFQDVLKVAKF